MWNESKRARVRCVTAVAIVAMTVAGCDSFLDVNENPNDPEHARIELTLPSVIAQFGHSVLTGSLAFWGAEWLQHFSFVDDNRGYFNVHRYELSSTAANSPWNAAYPNAMNEANNVMAEAEERGSPHYHGIAKFIQAWSFSVLTDAFGPIPFTEAFETEGLEGPAYDDQQVVYEGVHTMIEEAIEEMQQDSPLTPAENDLLYQGDMAKWVRLAHTVRATLHLRLAYAPGEDPANRAQLTLDALQQGFQSNADDADFWYPGSSGRRSPWYTFRDNDEFVHSDFFITGLQERSDPRLPHYAEPAPADTPQVVYRGHESGTGGGDEDDYSPIGEYFSCNDEGCAEGDSVALNWVSYSHAKFVEAEARLILSGRAAADGPYREGIRASMEKFGIDEGAIQDYLDARPSLVNVADPLEEIIREKYVANFLKTEVWVDYRRTGHPEVPVVESEYLDHIPERIRFPDSELSRNANNVDETGIPTDQTGMSVQVWWASGTPPSF